MTRPICKHGIEAGNKCCECILNTYKQSVREMVEWKKRFATVTPLDNEDRIHNQALNDILSDPLLDEEK